MQHQVKKRLSWKLSDKPSSYAEGITTNRNIACSRVSPGNAHVSWWSRESLLYLLHSGLEWSNYYWITLEMQQRQDVKLQIRRHFHATLMKQGLECTFTKLTYFRFYKSLIFQFQRFFSFYAALVYQVFWKAYIRLILGALDYFRMFFFFLRNVNIQGMWKLTIMTGCVSTDDGPKELGVMPLDSANGSLTGFGGIRPGSHQLHSQVTVGTMACSKHEEG